MLPRRLLSLLHRYTVASFTLLAIETFALSIYLKAFLSGDRQVSLPEFLTILLEGLLTGLTVPGGFVALVLEHKLPFFPPFLFLATTIYFSAIPWVVLGFLLSPSRKDLAICLKSIILLYTFVGGPAALIYHLEKGFREFRRCPFLSLTLWTCSLPDQNQPDSSADRPPRRPVTRVGNWSAPGRDSSLGRWKF